MAITATSDPPSRTTFTLRLIVQIHGRAEMSIGKADARKLTGLIMWSTIAQPE